MTSKALVRSPHFSHPGDTLLQVKRELELCRSMLDATSVGMARLSPEGRFVWVNPAFAQLLNIAVADFQLKSVREFIHRGDLVDFVNRVRKVIAGEESSCALEHRYRREDGSYLKVKVQADLVRGNNARPAYFMVIVLA